MEAYSGREGRRAFQVDRWSGVAGGGFGRGWGHSWEITCKHLSFLFANTFMCIISFEPHTDSSSIHFREDKDEESKSSVSGLHSLPAGDAGTSPSAPRAMTCALHLCSCWAAGNVPDEFAGQEPSRRQFSEAESSGLSCCPRQAHSAVFFEPFCGDWVRMDTRLLGR